jgi:cytochrome c-type biogenesis protein
VSELTLLALAIGLGLVSFVEPCTVGASGIFLGYLREKDRAARLRETAKFTLVRSGMLGVLGFGTAFLGGFVLTTQRGTWLFLGLVYLVLGLAVILHARFGLLGRFSLGRLLPGHEDRSLGLGFLFGLNIPACSYPLILALLGRGAASGPAWGFTLMFVFGLALSLPLVPLAFSERTAKLLVRLSRFGKVISYAIGIALLVASAYTLYIATPYFVPDPPLYDWIAG